MAKRDYYDVLGVAKNATEDELAVLQQHALWLPVDHLHLGQALFELLVRYLQLDLPCRDIDRNLGSIAHRSDWTFYERLRRDMADAWPPSGAGEAAVRDERHRIRKPHLGICRTLPPCRRKL